MTFRFLHSSDLHLGKPFGGFSEGIRNRLREERHGAIARLARAAREGGAQVILLAGDTFDAETPSPDTLRHALHAMSAEKDITWVLMPGNHDSLAATELWRRVRADGGPNLRLVSEPAPVALAPDVTLLPAPCTQRRPGRDLTDWMTGAATADGQHRLGLAHGAITDFTADQGAAGIIPPDRAAQSGLGYLALGDWHGAMAVGDRTWYSGTPEADSFRHDAPSVALLVTLTTPGAPPQVTPVATGVLRWLAAAPHLVPGDGAERLDGLLPPVAARRNTLLRFAPQGRVTLPDRAALIAALDAIRPDFGWCEENLDALATEARPDDLDMIDRAGALRQAAEVLLAEAGNPALAAADRAVADLALSRLFVLSQEVAS